MDSAKKQHERFLLDRFLELQGISPTRVDESESPDFLIDLEGRKVGIEVTELFIRSRSKGHPQREEKPLPQEVESITKQIVCEARRIYLDADTPPSSWQKSGSQTRSHSTRKRAIRSPS